MDNRYLTVKSNCPITQAQIIERATYEFEHILKTLIIPMLPFPYKDKKQLYELNQSKPEDNAKINAYVMQLRMGCNNRLYFAPCFPAPPFSFYVDVPTEGFSGVTVNLAKHEISTILRIWPFVSQHEKKDRMQKNRRVKEGRFISYSLSTSKHVTYMSDITTNPAYYNDYLTNLYREAQLKAIADFWEHRASLCNLRSVGIVYSILSNIKAWDLCTIENDQVSYCFLVEDLKRYTEREHLKYLPAKEGEKKVEGYAKSRATSMDVLNYDQHNPDNSRVGEKCSNESISTFLSSAFNGVARIGSEFDTCLVIRDGLVVGHACYEAADCSGECTETSELCERRMQDIAIRVDKTGVHFEGDDFQRLLSVSQTLYPVDREILEAFAERINILDDLSNDALAPLEVSDLAKLTVGDKLGLLYLKNGDIFMTTDQRIVMSRRNGRWIAENNVLFLDLYYNFVVQPLIDRNDEIFALLRALEEWRDLLQEETAVNATTERREINQARKQLKAIFYNIARQEANPLLNTCFDVSSARTGGCICVIQSEAVKDDLEEIIDRKDFLSADDNPKNKILSTLYGGQNFFKMDRKVRRDMLAIDGSTIITRNGEILAVGVILKRIVPCATGGARTAAAIALSNYGFSVKISSDGSIEHYVKGGRGLCIKIS